MDKLEFAAKYVDDLPSAAARSLEALRAEDVSAFVDQIPDPLSSKALQHMLPHHAAQCLQKLAVESSVRYLAPLPVSNIAVILRHLTQQTREEIVGGLPNHTARRVARLLDLPRTAVGSWTDVDTVALPQDCTIGEAQQRILAEAGEAPSDIFVVDTDQRLVGEVWIGLLATAAAEKHLGDILQPVAHSLSATASVEAAIVDTAWQHTDILPVVDQADLFMGTLSHRALRQAIAQLAVDQPAAQSASSAFSIADTWFSGMAMILEVLLTAPSERTATE